MPKKNFYINVNNVIINNIMKKKIQISTNKKKQKELQKKELEKIVYKYLKHTSIHRFYLNTLSD